MFVMSALNGFTPANALFLWLCLTNFHIYARIGYSELRSLVVLRFFNNFYLEEVP